MKKFIPFSIIALVILALVMTFQPDIKPAAATPVEETGSANVVMTPSGHMINLTDLEAPGVRDSLEAYADTDVALACVDAAGAPKPDCEMFIVNHEDCIGGTAIMRHGTNCCNYFSVRPPTGSQFCIHCVDGYEGSAPPEPQCVGCSIWE